MKIFVSHSHKDKNAAKALVDMLLSSLVLEDKDVLCTSVAGHKLHFGKTISELLKKDIKISPVLIALVSKKSLASDWVMFELGAAWGLDRNIYPILGPDIDIGALPGPLSHLSCIEVESSDATSRTSDLIQQLSEELGLTRKTGGKAQANLEIFIDQYRSDRTEDVSSNSESKSTAENQEENVTLCIWNMDKAKYDDHGYSLETISNDTSISIPKCKHVLNILIEKELVEVKKWMGSISGNRYLLKQAGRNYLLEKALVE